MLKEAGPFTTPLCIAMVFALRWLIQDRARVLDELRAAQEDQRAIRDKRTEDQRAAAVELREYGDAISHRLEEWTKRAERERSSPPKE